MKFSLSLLALLFYVIPALTSYWVLLALGYTLNNFALQAIYASALAACTVYFLSSRLIFKRKYLNHLHTKKIYTTLVFVLLIFGLLSIALNFLKVKSFPLFAGNALRLEMQETFLWNIYIFCASGIFLSAYCSRAEMSVRSDRRIKWLIGLYFLAALLSGWKGVLINFIFMYLISRYKHIKINFGKLLYFIIPFFLLFFVVNYLRVGASSVDYFAPIFYIYWGFVNFSEFAGNISLTCFSSNPFEGCQLPFGNDFLVDQTWNVYTALAPLYVDGGIFYTCIFFGIVIFLLVYSSRIYGSLFFDYLHYICFYFLFFAHNGYAFSSKSIYFALAMFFVLDVYRMYRYRRMR